MGNRFPYLNEEVFFNCRDTQSGRQLYMSMQSSGTGLKNYLRDVTATLRCSGNYVGARNLYGVKGSIACFMGIGCGFYFGRTNGCILMFHERASFGFSGMISQLSFFDDYGAEILPL